MPRSVEEQTFNDWVRRQYRERDDQELPDGTEDDHARNLATLEEQDVILEDGTTFLMGTYCPPRNGRPGGLHVQEGFFTLPLNLINDIDATNGIIYLEGH